MKSPSSLSSMTVVDVYEHPFPCEHDCEITLSNEERAQGIRAMFRFDDAIRGWGYQPLYRPGALALFREAQWRADASYRGVAVREGACIYQRLVGFAIHETLHLLLGDSTQPNYGIPFAAPYGIPEGRPASDEDAYLAPLNFSEARAWCGIAPLARQLFGIEWELRTARDVGTYGFTGGNALVPVPPGFRPIPHIDRVHTPGPYYARARKLEDEAAAWFTQARIADLAAHFEAAEQLGAAKRKSPWPDLDRLLARPARWPGRTELCPCRSGEKWKRCCGPVLGLIE